MPQPAEGIEETAPGTADTAAGATDVSSADAEGGKQREAETLAPGQTASTPLEANPGSRAALRTVRHRWISWRHRWISWPPSA